MFGDYAGDENSGMDTGASSATVPSDTDSGTNYTDIFKSGFGKLVDRYATTAKFGGDPAVQYQNTGARGQGPTINKQTQTAVGMIPGVSNKVVYIAGTVLLLGVLYLAVKR